MCTAKEQTRKRQWDFWGQSYLWFCTLKYKMYCFTEKLHYRSALVLTSHLKVAPLDSQYNLLWPLVKDCFCYVCGVHSSIWWLLKADLKVNKSSRVSVTQRYGTPSIKLKKKLNAREVLFILHQICQESEIVSYFFLCHYCWFIVILFLK